jgi:hypothetical protein
MIDINNGTKNGFITYKMKMMAITDIKLYVNCVVGLVVDNFIRKFKNLI